jgi:hypothetical protein
MRNWEGKKVVGVFNWLREKEKCREKEQRSQRLSV